MTSKVQRETADRGVITMLSQPSVLTQSVLRPMLYSPGRFRPRPRVPADQLHHAAAVRLRGGASAKGRLGEQHEEEEEEGGQEREPRQQHHRGPEGADEQSSDFL